MKCKVSPMVADVTEWDTRHGTLFIVDDHVPENFFKELIWETVYC